MMFVSRHVEHGPTDPHAAPAWSFLTNHARVLLAIAGDPGLTLRAIGDAVGITERAAYRIVDELAAAGYISRERLGRRNQYSVHTDRVLADPVAGAVSVGALLDALRGADDPRLAS